MDEILDVVDKNDKVIGQALKSECHKKGLWHRGAAVMVINKKGEILIQRRSQFKDKSPGLLCISASGHVGKGESYEEAAKRELEEEVGIVSDLRLIDRFSTEHSGSERYAEKEHIQLFICQWDKVVKFKDGEVSEAKFFPPEEVKKMVFENPEKLNPASVIEFKRFFKNQK